MKTTEEDSDSDDLEDVPEKEGKREILLVWKTKIVMQYMQNRCGTGIFFPI